MPMHKMKKRLHRSVVLPDYQGIGIGMNFKNAVCDIIRKEGWVGQIWSVTTTPAQFHAQIKSDKWRLIRFGRASRHVSSNLLKTDMRKRIVRNSSTNRITYSFIYVGAEQKEQITSNEAIQAH